MTLGEVWIRPMRKTLAIAYLVLGLLSLSGCAHLLGPRSPGAWDKEVRERYHPAAVAIDGGHVLTLTSWLGNGVLVHSSARGTYVLTNEHIARQLVDDGSQATVHVFDPVAGTAATYPAVPFAPSRRELQEIQRVLDSDSNDTTAMFSQIKHGIRRLSCDLALLELPTAPAGLPVASLAVGSRRALKAQASFVSCSVYPRRSPQVALVTAPLGLVSALPGEQFKSQAGMSGSGIFTTASRAGDGRLAAVAAWGQDDATALLGTTNVQEIVEWLRKRGLEWVSQITELDAARLRANTMNVGHLWQVVENPLRPVYFDVRVAALDELARREQLDERRLVSLARDCAEPAVRVAALRHLIAVDRDVADKLSSEFASSNEGLMDVLGAVAHKEIPGPACMKALRAVVTDETRDNRERVMIALRLLEANAIELSGVPVALAQEVLASRLVTEIEFGGLDEERLGDLLDRLSTRLGCAIVLEDDTVSLDTAIRYPTRTASFETHVRMALTIAGGEGWVRSRATNVQVVARRVVIRTEPRE